ncbi:MAG: tetratricopeptide repeat protein [Flavobacteriales bacterium]|nr:tetratricopeptide repeat protein [Flavobacteriales bacterium]
MLLATSMVANAQNYVDSIASSIQNYSPKKQVEILLAIPYDKVVANTPVAEQLYLNTLKHAVALNNKIAEADIYNQLAMINGFLGNYDKRLDYNLKAIKIYEATSNKSKAGITYAELGFAMKRRDIYRAIVYMQKGVHLLKEINDEVALNSVYDNYGIVQEIAGNVDSAIYYYNKALDLKRNQNDSIGIPFALGHLSGAYLVKKDYKKSKEYLDESYAIRKKRNDTYGIAECLVLYADFYYAQENYKEAVEWFIECYDKAIDNKYIHLGQYAAEYAAICYSKLNNYEMALVYQKNQRSLKDSLLNESTNKTIAEIETQFETEKKETQIIEQDVLIAKKELEIKQRSYFMYALIVIGLLLFVIGFFIIKQVKFKQQKLIAANRLKDEIAKAKTKEKLNQERLRISHDLHDNIGAQLTFIISSIDNMSYFLKDTNNELKTKLQELNEFSRSAIAELRVTINKLNKSK